MNREPSSRQQVSELVDGELEPQQLRALLALLNAPAPNALRDDWDLYHRMGDCLRSEQMDGELSEAFSRRFSERLAAEPTVLAPHPEKFSGRFRGWSITLTAVAAAATGLALSPMLFHAPAGMSPSSLASVRSADTASVRSAAGAPAMLAQAGSAMTNSRAPEYILLHQSANPSLYGAPALARQAAFGSSAEK